MIKQGLRKRVTALVSAVTALMFVAAAVPSSASADTMRTLNVALSCETGLPYGMSVNNGSGWYYPNGSSYAVGTTKYFTVYIPASASEIAIDTGYCDNENPSTFGEPWYGSYYGLTPGTSTINANGYCYWGSMYPGFYFRACTLSNITYS
ncbi:MAG TPA: hypothetical protein VGS97_28490 [Actinocrinis sp.]|uniref:hypothetical protein n=1 Tax=Actinocrinis sp. TaxID=1920516 RepID=UPI002DDCB17F|nr:hypothetical protein [Actinocrinis sp.]HEV2348059.1 hypothetical protein [Actinocrinis sp.]